MTDVGPAIFELLTTNTLVREYCATRVYPQLRKQGDVGDAVVYELVYNEPQDTASGPSTLDVIQYQVKSISENRDRMQRLRESIRYTLERLTATVAGVNIQSIRMIDQREDFDDNSKEFYTTDDYSFRIIRSNFTDKSISPYQYRQRVQQAGGEVVGFDILKQSLIS